MVEWWRRVAASDRAVVCFASIQYGSNERVLQPVRALWGQVLGEADRPGTRQGRKAHQEPQP